MNRREAIARITGLMAAAWLPANTGRSHRTNPFPHPEPRAGVTAEHVLPESDLPDVPEVRTAYAAARSYPEIFDGIYCPCDCHDSLGHRSLLSCFESRQPTGCGGCRESAEIVAERAKEGRSLAEIRTAIDDKYGAYFDK